MKKIIPILIFAMLAAVLAACGSDSAAEKAAAEEAADSEVYEAELNFDNETGYDITELYVCTSDDDSWGDNLLNGDVLPDGIMTDGGVTVTYTPDMLFDFDFVTADGKEAAFTGFDFADVNDPANILITITVEDGEPAAYIN